MSTKTRGPRDDTRGWHGPASVSLRRVLPVGLLAFAIPGVVAAQSAVGPSALQVFGQPALFVENRGQWDGDFLYKTRVGLMTVFVERGGFSFTLEERGTAEKPREPGRDAKTSRPDSHRGAAVRMRFAGGATADAVVPGARGHGTHNYFLGNDPGRWRTELPLYENIRLVGVWPGVDVSLRIEDGHIEYDVFVEPGRSLDQIVLDVEGSDGLRMAPNGELIIDTPLGPVRQTAPRSWEVRDDGSTEAVSSAFSLLGESRFGFSAPDRDLARRLVIDPGLVFGTFLGGSGLDHVTSVSVDPTGAATAVGFTSSVNFPTTVGAYDTSHNGPSTSFGHDIFVVRLNATGSGIDYATYVGGAGIDYKPSVALDATGAATVAGWTTSTNFPTTPGAYDTSYNGGAFGEGDAFVFRLNAAGSGLAYSTYLGGAGFDAASSVALDATGAATVAGQTLSTNFPTTSGAYDASFNGGGPTYGDAFVVRLNPTGSALDYATFLGGADDDGASSVALDGMGAATVVGLTLSTNFPTTAGAYDTSHNGGGRDAFVVRLNPTGSALDYATFLGGSGGDSAYSVAVDATGAATVAGTSDSTNFPTTAGAYDASYNGGTYDAFVVRLNPTGSGLLYSTYIGGGSIDYAYSVAIDATGAATVAGESTSANFPTTAGAYDTSHNGGYDAFIVRLNAAGNALLYASYLGGSAGDAASSVALDPGGVATVAGVAAASGSLGGFPTTPGAFNTVHGGGTNDGFVVRLQLVAFTDPLMAFPGVQSVPAGGILGVQIVGPAAAPVALMFDTSATSIPVPPFGVLGVGIPPLATVDGIGLGFPGSIPVPLSIGSQGILYFSYSPVPTFLTGTTLYVQAVAVDASFPGLAALSTHGSLSLPTPSCRVDFVP